MSVETLKQAMLNKAADQMHNNEDEAMQRPVQVHHDPAGRKPGTLDALWGDEPPDPEQHSDAVRREAKDDRNEQLERLFTSPASSARSEQAEMNQLLEHAGEGHPHSPLLQRGKQASADDTLTDQVVRVVGRR